MADWRGEWTPSNRPYIAYQSVLPEKDHRIRRGLFDIISIFAIAFFPPVALSAILLVLVFYNLVHHNETTYPDLSLPGETDENGVYYVRLNSTILVLLSSFSSTVAPILTGFFLSLVSYVVSLNFLRLSQSRDITKLPSPFQVGLLVSALGGGKLGSLWTWIKYKGWTKKRKTSAPLKLALGALIIVSLLSYTHIATFDLMLAFLFRLLMLGSTLPPPQFCLPKYAPRFPQQHRLVEASLPLVRRPT